MSVFKIESVLDKLEKPGFEKMLAGFVEKKDDFLNPKSNPVAYTYLSILCEPDELERMTAARFSVILSALFSSDTLKIKWLGATGCTIFLGTLDKARVKSKDNDRTRRYYEYLTKKLIPGARGFLQKTEDSAAALEKLTDVFKIAACLYAFYTTENAFSLEANAEIIAAFSEGVSKFKLYPSSILNTVGIKNDSLSRDEHLYANLLCMLVGQYLKEQDGITEGEE